MCIDVISSWFVSARIEISDKESDSPWQKRDYKVFSPSTTLETVDYSSAPPIMDIPVNSFICSHEDGTTVARGAHKFQGYAHSGGGRQVVRVEVSTDKGNTWKVVDSLRTEKPVRTLKPPQHILHGMATEVLHF